MKRFYLTLFFLPQLNFTYAQADAGPDRAICGGSFFGIELGAMEEDSKFCYSWKALPADPSIDNKKTAKIRVNPSKTTTYTLTVIGEDFATINTDDVKVSIVNDVVFSEAASQKYGFDYHTSPGVPWKSVEKGKSDPIKVTVTPSDGYEGVFFKVNSFSFFKDVDIAPVHSPSDKFDLNITGIDEGDDEVDANCEKEDGDKIKEFNVKCASKISKTVAVRLVHETSYNSTDASDAAILDYLNNKVYNQGIVEWTLIRLPTKTVSFDLNSDGKLDVSTWKTTEMQKIIDDCKDDDYDNNIFLVDNPSSGIYGIAYFNQRYGFVHGNTSPHIPTTFAHEIGHCAFGLEHSSGDGVPVNIMTQGPQNKYKLWKGQWDKINP